jgi:hypothetical protein
MKRTYQIIYGVSMLTILLLIAFWKSMPDTIIFLLAAFGVILTSIFTYSGRKK